MKRPERFYVYILHCSDDSYYTGMTNSLKRRMKEHAYGINDTAYTHSRRPFTLVYSETHLYVNNAIAREKQIKRWTRAKKQALINRDISRLKQLSTCLNRSHAKNFEYDKGLVNVRGAKIS